MKKNFDPKTLHPRAFYSYFSGIMAPRLIAWISTLNEDQSVNIAPYSFFTGANTRPPMVIVSIGRTQGELKHTALNILREKECVIHMAEKDMIEKLNASAKRLEINQSEATYYHIEVEPSLVLKTPSIQNTVFQMECRLFQHIKLPENDLFILEVIQLKIEEKYLKDGQIDVEHYHPLTRLMGNYYATHYEMKKMSHPDLIDDESMNE
jgi:flavin reductase (DIM6/NTAB) family NADH-FMN oxidoreductase RutF